MREICRLGATLAVLGGLLGCPQAEGEPALTFLAMAFNTGTTEGMAGDEPRGDGYTAVQGGYSDQYYGDGLAWRPAVEAARDFLRQVKPDVVGFQEIFYSGDCPTIPAEAQRGFVCEGWQAGDPTVANVILGEGYQVACHLGRTDKCAAVRRGFGRFEGCDGDLCLDLMFGSRVEGCGSAARVGRASILLAAGGRLTLVNFHGTSGLSSEEQACRVQQVEQVFVDLGDGDPAASGERNLVLGDLNTDPGRMASFDASAARWLDFAGLEPGDKPFHFVTDASEWSEPSYGGMVSIDHVISDSATGSCWTAGLGEDHPLVYSEPYFDHKPVACALTLPGAG